MSIIDYLNVGILNIDFSAIGSMEIYQNLKTIYTTPAGTVPFDRNFGIDISIIDEPINIARGKLIVEYTAKTRKYEPRAVVSEVNFDTDPQNGKIVPKVVIIIESE